MPTQTDLDRALDAINRCGAFSESEKEALRNAFRVVFIDGTFNLGGGNDDDVLTYDLATDSWGPEPIPGLANTFVSLTDTPGSFTADQWVKVNAGGTALEFSALPTSTYALNDLTDVTLGTPSLNHVLTYNGSVWVSQASPSAPVDSVNGQTGVVVIDIDDLTPTTTKGDILVENGSNVVRLGVGTDTHVLTADSSEPSGVKWAAQASGFADPMTTRGDIIYKDSGGSTTRLAAGTSGYVLTSDGTDIAWQPSVSGASDFTALNDTPANYTSQSEKLVRVNTGETALEFIDASTIAGASVFTDLTDTPASYAGAAEYFVKVNAAANGLEFVSATPVTQVTASLPISSSGGTTPNITIREATASQSGYMSAAYAAKLDGIEAGADVTDSINVEAAGAYMGDITVSTSSPSGGDNGDLWFQV